MADSSTFANIDPATAGYATLVSQGIAGVIGAFGSGWASKYNNRAADAYANIARINAQTMEENAQHALRSAESSIMKTTMAAGQHKAKQRVAQGKSGFAIGAGSNAEALASTDIVKTIDANQIKSNAVREAGSYRMKKASYLGQALMAEAGKTSAASAFTTSLLSTAGQIGINYLGMASRGQFDSKPSTISTDDYWSKLEYGIAGSSAYDPYTINFGGYTLGRTGGGYLASGSGIGY